MSGSKEARTDAPGDGSPSGGPTGGRVVLLLGGTAEARVLAARLAAVPGLRVVSSLAGRTSAPVLPVGETRVGGFGGVPGLVAWLRARAAVAVVDATHPFAARISANAVTACAEAGVPLLRLQRPGWTAVPGDRWYPVDSADEAARVLPGLARRVFLTTGRLETAPYAHLDDLWFLLRSVEPPTGALPRACEVLLSRGPFTVEDEIALLRDRRIDAIVTKDSGGAPTAAKLTAARELGLPVVLIRRPEVRAPQQVTDAAAAARWVLSGSAAAAGT
ncbi:cobalt-precorrin-6A reductase [Streptomyces scabrisporus]|uniref:cobalt-precorrin-6A reductase n=1 Tax=Embleya scabrispora TaxID=159449 RepID=UPI00036D0739